MEFQRTEQRRVLNRPLQAFLLAAAGWRVRWVNDPVCERPEEEAIQAGRTRLGNLRRDEVAPVDVPPECAQAVCEDELGKLGVGREAKARAHRSLDHLFEGYRQRLAWYNRVRPRVGGWCVPAGLGAREVHRELEGRGRATGQLLEKARILNVADEDDPPDAGRLASCSPTKTRTVWSTRPESTASTASRGRPL